MNKLFNFFLIFSFCLNLLAMPMPEKEIVNGQCPAGSQLNQNGYCNWNLCPKGGKLDKGVKDLVCTFNRPCPQGTKDIDQFFCAYNALKCPNDGKIIGLRDVKCITKPTCPAGFKGIEKNVEFINFDRSTYECEKI